MNCFTSVHPHDVLSWSSEDQSYSMATLVHVTLDTQLGQGHVLYYAALGEGMLGVG